MGTVNVKRNFIPLCFLKSKNREIISSMFVFSGPMSLVSYVPKINRSVILLSTHHHDDSIDFDNRSNKPEIINFYNRNKGGVDSFDQLLENNTVRRKTHRWTMNIFYFLIDASTQNAFALKLLYLEQIGKRVIDRERLKQNELEILVKNLITPNAKERYNLFKLSNFKHVKSYVLEQIRILIPELKKLNQFYLID